MGFTLSDLAAKIGGTLIGDGQAIILGVAGIETAESGDLLFAESPRFLRAAIASRATAVLVTPELASPVVSADKALILVANPRISFAHAMNLFDNSPKHEPGIHPSALIGEGSMVGDGAHIGANVVLGRNVSVADGAALLPGVIVGDRCTIGEGTVLHPNVVLYPDVTVGKACILHAGCILGSDGFGFVQVGNGLMKVPHLGTVEVGDDVELGANTCIDRAKTGVTRIGSGTKMDNLVHIAHNTVTGQSCLILAQVGLAGTVTLGNGVIIAGQAGIKDHLSLGDGARVTSQAGVNNNVSAGETVSGYFAKPHHEVLREVAALAHLPDVLKRLRDMEKRLAACEAGLVPGESAKSQ